MEVPQEDDELDTAYNSQPGFNPCFNGSPSGREATS